MATKKQYTYAVGRRKTAVAQVRLFAGEGKSTINELPFDDFINRSDLFNVVLNPFKVTATQDKFHFEIKVEGSGESAQAQAISHGLSRALMTHTPELKATLRAAGLLTRDSRQVERKKPGLHKARKASQWSKR
jgi:small subunit ribosomal protein S9